MKRDTMKVRSEKLKGTVIKGHFKSRVHSNSSCSRFTNWVRLLQQSVKKRQMVSLTSAGAAVELTLHLCHHPVMQKRQVWLSG